MNEVAYRFIKSDGIIVYYSTAFGPYREQLERIKNKPSLAERFKFNYEIWIGYHAILQSQEIADSELGNEIDLEKLEKLQEKERAVVAAVQAKQAIKTSELQRKLISESSTS